MKRAIELNSAGVAHLLSNEQGKALDCFKAALQVVSVACCETKSMPLPTRSAHFERVQVHKIDTKLHACDGCSDLSHDHGFVINSLCDDSYETGSLYSAVIIYNYALCLQHKNGGYDRTSLQRASRLYSHSLELLDAISDCFDRGQVSEVAIAALHNLADTEFKLGDYQSFRRALDSIMMLDVKNKVLCNSQEDSPSAPAA